MVVDQNPEMKNFSSSQLRIVKKAVHRAIILADHEVLSPEETKKLFLELVPDLGTPASALRAYRGREDLTQRALSKKCGIPQSHIAAMESGARPIGLMTAKKLALALNCDYKRLI